MIVAGVMSGTSADGINVAVVKLSGRGFNTRFELLAHEEFPYPAAVRRQVLATMNATAASVADLSRLGFLLGELYAEAVLATQAAHSIRAIELVGCHGQTIYHQGTLQKFLGRPLAVTWQIGEGAIVAARTGAHVVSDFRVADMAVGGKGAPLVPFLDYVVYRDRRVGRILQNLGGIGNLTAIPRAGEANQVIAFDTGPGNMVIDQCMERLFRRPYDQDGAVAARGKVLERVVAEIVRAPFFRAAPPKTAGREEFGREFVARFLKRCGEARRHDVIATATALTAASIADALRRFVRLGDTRANFRDYVIAGGGSKNPTLVRMLAEKLEPLGLRIRRSEEFGVPAEAKEAIAFAVMAHETWHRRPANVPSATGAKRPAILGKISYAPR